MIELVTATENLPFSVALCVVALLAVLQVVGVADIVGADADLEADVDTNAALDAGLLSLVGLGRVPFMMWLMILLSAFGLIGLAGQQILAALTGTAWSAWLTAPASGIVALPVTGAVCVPLRRIMPRDETSAIDLSALVGREAEIVIGTASPGNPARAKVIDHFGQAHHVMLEPDNADQRFATGERVLLVRRERDLFKAMARGDHYLPKLD